MTDPVLVEVTWRDAFFDFEQSSTEDTRDDYLVRTVGYVVDEDGRWLHIAAELLPDGDGFRAVTHVPLTSIHSRTTLERVVP